MKKEFNLSEKITDYRNSHQEPVEWLETKDVKEFIKLLKEELKDWGTIEKAMEGKSITQIVDKLAGDKLTDEKHNTTY